ncbi:DUF1837 domain-containing protein [Rhizobium leguminosarum]|nr:DUF1837 domain-containing protein [Rhizobium leguminosarum]
MSNITISDLEAILAGDPEELGVYLQLVERDVVIDGHNVKVHCHCLAVDGNGRVQPKRLAQFMRNAVADYAIPRSKLQEARLRDLKFRSSSAVAELHRQACAVFTDLEKTGEGGEMLLFLLAERFLKLPQVLCKMDLKTDRRMHYHGADGVYAGVGDDGRLKLYWGESKIYGDATTAIRDCLSSLAPFLLEDDSEGAERERDLLLLSDRADLSDPALTEAFKRFFNRKSPLSNRVEYCGIALVGFDAAIYPVDGTRLVAEELVETARKEIARWAGSVGSRLKMEKLDQFDIEFLCVPIPSADGFRAEFLDALGLSK